MIYTHRNDMPRIETATQRKRRLALAKVRRRKKFANETHIQRQIRLENRRSARFEWLLNEPLEERFFRQYIDKIHAQDRRKSETPEQRAERIEKCRIRAHERKGKSQVCDVCRQRYYPHEVTKYNRNTSQTPFLRELQESKEEFILCYQCNDHLPDSSGLDQPSCSSFADASDTFSEPLPMEEQSEPEPVTMLEIKQEVLWDGEQNCSKEVEPARGYQSIPASEQMEEEDAVRAALEQMRGEISALARGDELSAGLEQIRGEIRDLARGDEFDAFGRYVASLLRNMRPRRAQQAQPLIINLLAAEMIKKDDDET